MAHDGLPQRVINQDLLVLNVRDLAGAAVEGALGIGAAASALTWDPEDGYAPVAPNADGCPRPGDSGVS